MAVSVFCACAARAEEARAPALRPASSLVKVPRRGAFPTEGALRVEAARGEWENVQLVALAGTRPLQLTSVRAGALTGPGGARIAPPRLFRVDYVRITTPSNIEGWAGEWPDPLIPDGFPVTVPAGANQPIWIHIRVPEQAPPGSYRGHVAVEIDGATREVPLEVVVFPFAIPQRPTLPILVGFAGRTIARGHQLAVEQDPDLTRRYALALLEHRLQPIGGSFDPPPYHMEGSRAVVDWRPYDAEWKPLLDAGLQMIDLRLPARAPARDRAALAGEWVRHFRERGWLARLFDYTYDEPRPDQYAELRARAEIAGRVGIPRLVTHRPDDPALAGLVDLPTPLINDVPAPVPRGSRVFWYQSCMSHGCDIVGGREFTGWPQMVVDVRSAVAHRIQEWLAFRYHIAGELYYNSVESYGHRSIHMHGGNGDGTLFYPGPGVPLPSIRLVLLRDAEEDYEYLHLAGARADSIAARIARTPRDWDADPRSLLAARHALAVEISNGVTKGNGKPASAARNP